MFTVCKFCIAAQSELFTEVGMAARFAARKVSVLLPCFSGGLNRVDNPRVTGAAAEVATERLLDNVTIARAALL